MKRDPFAITQKAQATYLDQLLRSSTGVLMEMEEFAAAHHVPISDREVARFIEIVVRTAGVTSALEIGMAIGYGALSIIKGMPAMGSVVTIELSEERIGQAKSYLTRAGVIDRTQIRQGEALKVLSQLLTEDRKFDLVYLDAVKEEYADYLKHALPLLKTGGIVLADNLLWGGQVATQPSTDSEKASTEALREFNKLFMNHPQLVSIILPFGDGLGYAVKID